MLRNFSVASLRPRKDAQTLLRLAIGLLLLANLAAAGFAFHVFGNPAEDTKAQLLEARALLQQQESRLARTRALSGKVEQARIAGDQFEASYMTDRRNTYSTVLAELNRVAKESGMTSKEKAIPPLEPIQGSDSLSMMTITANYEGAYENVLKFVNLLDKSQRFIIIETLSATPQATGNRLSIAVKVNTFVREDNAGGAA